MALPMVRYVYDYNLVTEFDLIRRSIADFPRVAIDTEFPGVVFQPTAVPPHLRSSLPPSASYAVMKKNVDSLKLIQLGLTLSDADGNLPSFGSPFQFFWEFHFQDFDFSVDLHNPESTSLLQRRGIDFDKNKKIGIDSRRFACLFMRSGLASRLHETWVTFHGMYDFGFLIKMLTGRHLPEDVDGFFSLVKGIFGPAVIDVKSLIGFVGLHGGLDRVAKSLGLNRVTLRSQAGASSFLTMQVFLTMRKKGLEDTKIKMAMGQLYGLACLH